MKFKDLKAPMLFSSTFKAFNLGDQIKYFQELSRMRGNPVVRTLSSVICDCFKLRGHMTTKSHTVATSWVMCKTDALQEVKNKTQ